MAVPPLLDSTPADPSSLETPAPPRPQGAMRDRILSAAARLLAAHGFDGTTLQAVADEVGVRKPSVLHHFPSKDALRKAVLERMLDHWNEVVPKIMLTARVGTSRFDALAGEMVRFFASDPNRARVILREMLDRPDIHRRVVSRDMSPWFEMIGRGIEEGKHRGTYLSEVDSEMYLAHILRFILVTIATSDLYGASRAGGPRAPSEREVNELLRIARAGLLTPGALRDLAGTAQAKDPSAARAPRSPAGGAGSGVRPKARSTEASGARPARGGRGGSSGGSAGRAR